MYMLSDAMLQKDLLGMLGIAILETSCASPQIKIDNNKLSPRISMQFGLTKVRREH